MFNLLISGNDESFRGEPWTLERNRVFEHTNDVVAAPYRAMSSNEFDELARLPTLIGYERGLNLSARLARIDRVRQRDQEIRVEYSFVPRLPEITPDQIDALAWELDIGKWELSRTHWALKDVDLVHELIAARLLTGEQIESVPSDFRHLFGAATPEQNVQIRPTIFRLPDRQIETDLVSVMLPFNAAFTGVFETVQETGLELGLRVLNANQVWEETEIIQDIFSLIYRSKVVVCDFSDRNPNVFYEAGIAHTLGRPVVPLAQRADDIPFDLRHHRHIVYLNNEQGLRGLKDELLPRLRSLTQGARQ